MRCVCMRVCVCVCVLPVLDQSASGREAAARSQGGPGSVTFPLCWNWSSLINLYPSAGPPLSPSKNFSLPPSLLAPSYCISSCYPPPLSSPNFSLYGKAVNVPLFYSFPLFFFPANSFPARQSAEAVSPLLMNTVCVFLPPFLSTRWQTQTE